ncbi:MAG: hypothetical protein ACYCWA_00260 [Thiobacillus sp.]
MSAYTFTSQQLAERLQTNPASIRAYRAGQRRQPLLEGLPEPVQTQPRLIWLVADIEAWLESRRTFRPPQTEATPPEREVTQQVKRGPGRPRKTGSEQ